MDLVSFYSLNILVGAVLATVLGLFGAHVVARNKTIEVIFLGQSIQFGILLGVLLSGLLHLTHNDHGLHFEMLVSVFITVLIYSIYLWLSKNKKYVKTPLLVTIYSLLIGLSYVTVAASPLIESHMVKSFVGDIVTAARLELVIILFLSLSFLVFFLKFKRIITLQSFDLSMFGHLLTAKNRSIYVIFNIIILTLMIYSTHVFGLVFTICMMLFPITIIQFGKISLGLLYTMILILAPVSVLSGFLLNISYENLPTSGLVSVVYLGLLSLFVFLYNVLKGKKKVPSIKGHN